MGCLFPGVYWHARGCGLVHRCVACLCAGMAGQYLLHWPCRAVRCKAMRVCVGRKLCGWHRAGQVLPWFQGNAHATVRVQALERVQLMFPVHLLVSSTTPFCLIAGRGDHRRPRRGCRLSWRPLPVYSRRVPPQGMLVVGGCAVTWVACFLACTGMHAAAA